MIKKFIERPVLATVVSMILIMLGIVGIMELPITRYPEIAPPSVKVSASYPGADAQTIANSVLLPLETAINGVEGMTYIKSNASSGSGSISIFFKQGINPNQAATNVQTRVSKANADLPAEVIESGVSVVPSESGSIMTLNVYSTDPAFDELFLQSYTSLNIIRELQRIDGVAGVSSVGSKNYAIRIWLNPNELRAYNLVPDDIKKAVQEQNFEIAPGEFGENSSEVFETTLKYSGRLTSQKEFENIIIKTNEDGSILHLKDIARVELSATNLKSENQVNNHPGLIINITQNSGANARDIDVAIRAKMKELAQHFPKGIHYDISYSVRNQVDSSIDEIIHTLFEAFILVFLVVLIFLQDFRATIIPAIAIPVALIGTFFFIYLLGFSINVLTLFALVLSIGIVVDDAIVVVEAIYHKMEHSPLSPHKATIATMKEITPAIISITLVMAAVFLPVGFMGGPSGVFYRQFAYTLAIAILISALNALTLSPALAALILRKPKEAESKTQTDNSLKGKVEYSMSRFALWFNQLFSRLTSWYIKVVLKVTRKRKLAIAGLAAITLLGVILMNITPSAFIPNEDDGFIVYSLKLPPGSSLASTNNVLKEALTKIQHHKEIKSMSSSAGFNAIDNATSTSYAMGYINMYPHKERKGIKDIERFVDTIRADLSAIKGAEVSVYTRPTVEGFGDENGVKFVIEDRLGDDFKSLGAAAQSFLKELNQQPGILKASTTFEPNFPQIELEVDKEKAKALGIDIKSLLTTVRQYYSRVRISDFNLFNRLNRVYIQAEPQFAATESSLKSIFVRSKDGNMVPVSTLVKLNPTFGPEIVTRYNLYNSVEVSVLPQNGYSTGDVMKVIDKLSTELLPGNYQIEYTGLSLEEQKSGSQTIFIIILSFFFVYFLLSALYESYILPFAILLSVPLGLIGVYLCINLVGLQNNIYVQVGLLMLIGLLAKNAILIIEFSLQHRQRGNSLLSSAMAGARSRLRPILMTSFAFIAGMIPLMWSSGPSAVGNHSISYGAAGGMLSGVFLGIFIIPVLFIIFKYIDERLKMRFKTEK